MPPIFVIKYEMTLKHVKKYIFECLTCFSWRMKAMVHNSRNWKIRHFWWGWYGRTINWWRLLLLAWGLRLLRQSCGDHESPNFGPQLVDSEVSVELCTATPTSSPSSAPSSVRTSVVESPTHRLGGDEVAVATIQGAGLTAQNVDGLVSKNEQQSSPQ